MKKLLVVLTCLICALAVSGPAKAITIGLNDLIGTAVPGSPADPDEERVRLNQLISLYNAGTATPIAIGGFTYVLNPGIHVPAPDLPVATGGLQVQADDISSFNLDTPYLYLLAKFGNQDAFYYLDGQTGPITLPIGSPFPVQGGGLSHITLFNETSNDTPVPEPATLFLLGSGLIGLAAYGRNKLFRK